jgi:hypothetical protein
MSINLELAVVLYRGEERSGSPTLLPTKNDSGGTEVAV